MDTEVILDHIETDTEDIKLIHVDKEILIAQDDYDQSIHETFRGLDWTLECESPSLSLNRGKIARRETSSVCQVVADSWTN